MNHSVVVISTAQAQASSKEEIQLIGKEIGKILNYSSVVGWVELIIGILIDFMFGCMYQQVSILVELRFLDEMLDVLNANIFYLLIATEENAT